MKKPVYLFSLMLALALGVGTGYMLQHTPTRKHAPFVFAGNQKAPATISIPGLTADNYPRVNGSTSTMLLGDLLAARACGLQGELRRTASLYSWDATAVVNYPLDADPQNLEQCINLKSRTYHEGTHQAYMRLLQEKAIPDERTARAYLPREGAQIILVARKPSSDEQAAAQKAGIAFDVRPVALDAFVFMVNRENAVRALSLDQLREIYTGTVTSWKILGGNDEKIVPFTRNRNSGSQELMDALVMQGRKIVQGQDLELLTMFGPIERVSETPNSIGYSVYYYEHIMNPRPKLRLLAVDGVAPTAKTIANRRYPLSAEVYVVTRKGLKADHPAAILRDWLLSPEGQQVLADSGYIPIK